MEDNGPEDAAATLRTDGRGTAVPESDGEPDDDRAVEQLRADLDRLSGVVTDLRETVAARDERISSLESRLEDYRRRGEREREQLEADAVADLAERMLRVKDSVDAVSGVEDLDAEHHLELVARQFEKEFTAGDIDRIDTEGAYDARRHKMVDRVATAEVPEGEIVRELEAGYVVGDRVLRPARVVVATAPGTETAVNSE